MTSDILGTLLKLSLAVPSISFYLNHQRNTKEGTNYHSISRELKIKLTNTSKNKCRQECNTSGHVGNNPPDALDRGVRVVEGPSIHPSQSRGLLDMGWEVNRLFHYGVGNRL